jgi:hypothetical protein
MCNCTSRIHSFMCYLRNLATDANRAAQDCGSSKNAR